ncbi:MAG: flagellar protein G [Halodesulfurarchaeum sp.]
MAIVSSETLILFIAAVLVAGSVAGAMTGGINQLSDALRDRSQDVSQEIRTDVEVISDPTSGKVYDGANETITLLLKNTGSNTLAAVPSTVDLVVDGRYRSVQTLTVIDEPTWQPGAVARLTVTNVTLTGIDHRIVVHVNGNRDVFRFRTQS